MNLLGAKLYDPGAAVSKATSSLLAMTALDTTNLRVAVTVPAHGMVRFKMRCTITGATTCPTVLLGVLNSATVVGRVVPQYENATANAATQDFTLDAEFTATGLTPGSTNFDAAYAVQVVVASTNIKYGGPNTNGGNNAWGAFLFEAWDPQPIPTAAPGAANGLQICGANAASTYATLTSTGAFTVNGVSNVSQTGDSFAVVKSGGTGDNAAIKAKTDNLPAAPASTTNITAGTITTVTNLTNAPTAGDFTATMKTSITTAATAATPTVAAVTGAVGSVTGAVGSVAGNVGGNVAGSVASVTAAVTLPTIPNNWITAAGINAAALNGKGDWLLASGYTAPDNAGVTTLTGRLTAPRAALLDNLDAAVSSRSAYAGGDTSGTTTLLARLSALRAAGLDFLDIAISSRLASAAYMAPDNASVTAIKAKTDSLTFTVPTKLDVNMLYVNGVAVIGAGTAGSPWGPGA